MSEQDKCCPNCFHKKRFAGLKGMVDVCADPDCLCHKPLSVNVRDESKAADKFGR